MSIGRLSLRKMCLPLFGVESSDDLLFLFKHMLIGIRKPPNII